MLLMPVRAVPSSSLIHLRRGQTEQEHVLLAGFFGHFDGGAVASADRQGAIHHELHVAGAARLIPGGRNLLRHIARRDQPFSNRDAIVRQKNYFKPTPRGRIGVDGRREIVNEFDDELGQMVRRRRFAREEERPRRNFEVRILP